MEVSKIQKASLIRFAAIVFAGWVTAGFADNSSVGIQGITTNITGSFTSIGQLMAATAYLAGFALTIAAIFKFKQHKDNPAQIPMGTPIAMLVIGVCLIFLPGFIKPAGETIFGAGAEKAAGGYTGKGAAKLTDADQ